MSEAWKVLNSVSTSRCDAAAVIAAWLASSTPTSNNSATWDHMLAVCAMHRLRQSYRLVVMLSRSVDNASRECSCGQIAAADQGHVHPLQTGAGAQCARITILVSYPAD